MNLTAALLTASAGLLGIVLGTFLRPFVEEWFAQRRKTLHVLIQEPSEFRAPHESVLLQWHGEELRRLIQTGFRIENRTNRTLRNFRLEIGAPETNETNHVHAVYLESDGGARYSVNEEGYRSIFEFELIERNTALSGSMLSNFAHEVKFISLDDVELRKIRGDGAGGIWRYLAGVLSALGLVSMAGAAAALAGL